MILKTSNNPTAVLPTSFHAQGEFQSLPISLLVPSENLLYSSFIWQVYRMGTSRGHQIGSVVTEPASPPLEHTACVSRPGPGRSKTSYLLNSCHKGSPRRKLGSGLTQPSPIHNHPLRVWPTEGCPHQTQVAACHLSPLRCPSSLCSGDGQQFSIPPKPPGGQRT